MAKRRMFSMEIVDSDAFLEMPMSTRLLYYDLNMRADDDGFVNSPKKIMRMIGSGEDDIKLLIAKNFIIPFESGVVVIKHWRIHNYIRSDRKHETTYTDEKRMLVEKENGSYTLIQNDDNQMSTKCLPSDNQMSTTCQPNVSIGKDRIGKDRIGKDKDAVARPLKNIIPPTIEMIEDYCRERNNGIDATQFFDFYEAKGWKVGREKMKDWEACIRTWEKREAGKNKEERGGSFIGTLSRYE